MAESSEGVPARAVSAAERDRIVALLTRHYAEDRLTVADLEARLDRVYAALTLEELRAVVTDLPAVVGTAATPVASGTTPGAPPARATRRIRALLSGHEETLTGVVARRLRIRARLGYVELDLSRGTFEPGVTEINIRALMGYVQLRLPDSVRVESEGHGLFGYFAVRGSGVEDPAAPSVVRITGRALFGFAECHMRRGDSGTLGDSHPVGHLGPGEE
jgi:hypothetical protein